MTLSWRSVAWVVITLLVGQCAVAEWRLSDAQAEAARLDGMLTELRKDTQDAEYRAGAASHRADELQAVADQAARASDSIAAEASRIRAAARQAANDAEARLRTTLDSLNASTGSLDVLIAAHEHEVAALVSENEGLQIEVVKVRFYAESVVAVLEAERGVTAALRAENEALRRQVGAMNRKPSIASRLLATVGPAAVGYVAGSLMR